MAFQIIPYLLYFIPLVLAAGDFQLHPVRREYFCKSYRPIPGSEGLPPCDEGSSKPKPIEVDLRHDEQLIWGSPDADEAAALSFKMKPYPGQRVIDMGRFTDDIVAADCSENMSFQFKEGSTTFEKARESWDWVNKEEKRSFVLVGDPELCKSGKARDPWQVNRAEFDPANRTIRLAATKKEWIDVTYEYNIDFAAVEKKNKPSKRAIWDRSWSGAYEIPLNMPFPEELVTLGGDEDAAVDAKFAINCAECGLFGKLSFEGHIEGGIFKGVTRADLSVIPRDVHADVNLEFVLSGSYDSGNLPPGAPGFGKDFDIVEIPLPASWTVPGILELGPYANLKGGAELDSLDGHAKFTTGFSVKVPDDSDIVVNFISQDVITHKGWKPTFEPHPPTFEAQISATINLFLSLTPSLDLVVFGQRGVSVEFPFKFLSVDFELKAGYNSEGFCPPDKAPYGLGMDATLGVSMSAQVIERKAGKLPNLNSKSKGGKVLLFDRNIKEKIKLLPPEEAEDEKAARSLGTHETSPVKRDEVIFEKDLFNLDDLFTIGSVCKSFGDGNGEACEIFEPRPEEKEWYDAEIASADEVDASSKRRRQVTPRSRPLPRASGARELTYQCVDTSGDATKKFQIKPYPGPTKLMSGASSKGGSSVPIMLPKAKCDEESCRNPDNWDFIKSEDREVVILPKSKEEKSTWSTDHVFEANWLARFWEYMATKEGLNCETVRRDLLIGEKGGFADKLLGAIGNSQTYERLMTLLPINENGLKHRMFAGTSPDARFEGRTPGDMACSIGRIVSVCKLMEADEVKTRLEATIVSLDAIFKEMDGRSTITHAKDDNGNEYGYSKGHRDWFMDFYNKGIKSSRTNIIDFAQQLVKTGKLSELPKNTSEEITLMNACVKPEDCADFCPSDFKYPIDFPEKEEPKPEPEEPESEEDEGSDRDGHHRLWGEGSHPGSDDE
ncbi:hypothetical protein B0T10DRAFT_561197 [Thelonectria olida]|uniref:Uncharacterized protein n=1 Tax=Thelonectria olida TaxID=1576542 RepID=A0A9P8W7L7_9HYPO|nr:hypothetical protein B0T10DRAFT_561197 [Thelonectria olida]